MNIVDKTVAFFNPVAAVRRTAARATLDAVKNYGYSEGAASRKKKTMKNWRNESCELPQKLTLVWSKSTHTHQTGR